MPLAAYFNLMESTLLYSIRAPLREATRDKKQLNFGFLLNRLVSLDMFEELFFQPHIKQAKVPQKVWILVRPPPFSWKMSKL